jgi:L-threonylcarbamoyladenylate synthase
MEIFTREHIESRKQEFASRIKQGQVFIYPTDTIYGIGCDATKKEAVKRIREIKKRPSTPFSIIAPSKEWIVENLSVEDEEKDWIKRLPGPYTLILKKKTDCVADNVSFSETLGVRIPDHWFRLFVAEIKVPIISTSANITQKKYMTSLEDLDEHVKDKLDFVIYEGKKEGNPSKIIDLTNNANVIER